jgi:hypothetical protein
MTNPVRPLARSTQIVVNVLDDETLVYDLDTNGCACLEGVAATLWALCDGTHDLDDLAQATGLPESDAMPVVMITLEQLRAKGLMVESSLESAGEEFRGLSRRAMIKKAALVGVTVPIVTFLVAPTPAYAVSGCIGTNQPCTGENDPDCCPGTTCINVEAGPTGFLCFGCIPASQPCTVGGIACCNGGICTPIEGVPICQVIG